MNWDECPSMSWPSSVAPLGPRIQRMGLRPSRTEDVEPISATTTGPGYGRWVFERWARTFGNEDTSWTASICVEIRTGIGSSR